MFDQFLPQFLRIFVDIGGEVEGYHNPHLIRNKGNISMLLIGMQESIEEGANPENPILFDNPFVADARILVAQDRLIVPLILPVHGVDELFV